jgi:hypothetical protein
MSSVAQLSIFGGTEPVKGGIRLEAARQIIQQHRRKLASNVSAPTLPGDFAPPPPECEVSGKAHFWVEIKSYSTHRYWPASAYLPMCTYCGSLKNVPT